MSEYDRFTEYLEQQKTDCIRLSFRQIEDVIHRTLPKSARTYNAFWANSPSHPLMRRVLNAGWKKNELDFKTETVAFCKAGTKVKVHHEKTIQNPRWGRFEHRARVVVQKEFGIELQSEEVNICGMIKRFDFVNKDQKVVGDAKNYTFTKAGNWPSAKISVLNEYVWLMGCVERCDGSKWRKFLVIGEDEQLVKKYVKKYGPLLADTEIYFLSRVMVLKRMH